MAVISDWFGQSWLENSAIMDEALFEAHPEAKGLIRKGYYGEIPDNELEIVILGDTDESGKQLYIHARCNRKRIPKQAWPGEDEVFYITSPRIISQIIEQLQT